MTTIIKLNFKREDFEEIYFVNHQGSYLRSPTTKTAFRVVAIAGGFATCSLLYALLFGSTAISTTILILFVFALIYYIQDGYKLYTWKKEINTFLDREEQILKNTVVLSDKTFTFIQDDKKSIEIWENFKYIKISDEYVSLEGKENYIIPRKSMKLEEYRQFKEYLSQKIK